MIAGGSLVGLTAAVLLGHHGVRCLVVERHPGTAIHPRAAFINQRTIEIYRSVGLEPEILLRAGEEFLQDGAIVAVESLTGRELAYFLPSLNEGVRDVSPCPRIYCTQNVLEPILRRRARELGAQLAFSSEVESFEQDTDGVTSVVRDRESGEAMEIRSRYLIAADGNRSPARERLGIGMQGRGTFSNSATIYFRADVRALLRDRPLSVIYVNNAKLRGFMRFEADARSGFLAVNAVLDNGTKLDDVALFDDESRCVQLVRDAVGVPDLEVRVTAVQPWKAAADVATRFSDGRVMLAGDAAHTMPPTGGFGGNTGVQDAHNLAWKLALVLNGTAGPKLLDTYDTERRPAGRFAAEQAYTRYVLRTDPSLGDEDIQPQEDDLRIELGCRYDSPAIRPMEKPRDDAMHCDPRSARGLPGTRAPHYPLRRNGDDISAIDLFRNAYTLVSGPRGQAWCQAARDTANAWNLPMDIFCVAAQGQVDDPAGRFCDAYGIAPEGAVLVRPDGYVAWRSIAEHARPRALLQDSLHHLLCRDRVPPLTA